MTAPRRLVLSALLAALGCAAAASPAAAQASFDCKKAKSKVEKAICADKTMAAIDRKIAELYGKALKGLDPAAAEALKADQRAMLAGRDQAFGTEDFSLKEFLEYRQIQLETIDTAPRKAFDGAWINFGGSVTIGKGEKDLEASVSTSDGTVGRWLCDFTGIARPDGEDLVVEENAEEAAFEGWTLRISRQGNALTVKAVPPKAAQPDETPPFCGRAGTVDMSFVAARTE